jgi:hypothetical protein
MKNSTIPKRNYGPEDNKEFFLQIDSDNGDLAIRYLWIQHRFDNEEFLKNYFKSGNVSNINVRKQTAFLDDDWRKHNKIFDKSLKNGDLVWRFKILNEESKSIDYIEVWRSREIINYYFDRSKDVDISGDIWTADKREIFAKNLWDTGFDIRIQEPYLSISKDNANLYYEKLRQKAAKQENCIINTPWNRALNP